MKLRLLDELVMFHCPGCNEDHAITVKVSDIPGPVWLFNGDAARPTFQPSILVTAPRWEPPVTAANWAEWRRAPWEQKQVDHICHSFVTDGRIQFLGDCTHALAGQTVDLPDWEQL